MANIKSIGGNPIVLGLDGLDEDVLAAIAAQPEVTSGTEDEAAWLTRETAAGFPCGGRATVKAIKGHSEVVDGSLLSAKPTGIESTGRNLVHSATDRNASTNGITRIYLADANLLIVHGTATANNQDVSITLDKPITVLAGGSLTFSLGGSVSAVGTITCYAKVGSAYPEYRGMSASNGYQCTFTNLGGSTVEAFMLRFNTSTGAVSIEAHPQVEYGTTATEYEPYWSQSISIPIAQLKPEGLRSAGNVCDELTETEVITRIGEVDLGALTWRTATSRDVTYFYGDFSSLPTATPAPKLPPSNSDTPNMTCVLYTTVRNGIIVSTDKAIALASTSSRLFVHDDAYTDADAFKTAMSGVMLHYELATPTTTPLDPSLNFTYRTEAGGTETVTHTEATSAPTLGVVYEIDGTAAAASIAPLEGRVASTNYSLGSLLMLGGTLVKVTTAIATGEQIIIGQNCTATTVAAELAALA